MTSEDRERQAEEEWDRDVAELGERAAWEILHSEFGALYSRPQDRAWSVVLQCYGGMARTLGPDNVPGPWQPGFLPDGSWAGAA